MNDYVVVWRQLLQQWLWTIFCYIFTATQRFVWLFTGTYWTIRDNRRLCNYQRSAQVLDIITRYKFDGLCQLDRVSEFLTVHKCFDSPERVLQDHVSLYKVTDEEAIFVEALPGCELWRSSYSPFLFISQFRHPVRIIRMPISSFHRLADQLEDPSNVTFLATIGRSGSTIINQMFEHTGDVVTMSEPIAFHILAKKVGDSRLLDKSTEKFLISTVRLLCKPTSWAEKGHVIKCVYPGIKIIPILMSLFPGSHCCVLYRDGLKVAQSRCRVFHALPELFIYKACGRCEFLFWLVVKATRMHLFEYRLVFRSSYKHPLADTASQWADMMHIYRKWRESGLPVVAIRFEDIIADPESNMRRILRHCGLPEQSAVNSLRALQTDSQTGTPYSSEAIRRFAVSEYTGEVQAEVDAVCQSYGLPPFSSGPYVAPGTITSVEN